MKSNATPTPVSRAAAPTAPNAAPTAPNAVDRDPAQSAPPMDGAARPVRGGFVLYVGVNEDQAARAGTSVIELAETLQELARDVVPDAETHAALSLVPGTPAAEDVEEIRLRLAGA